MTGSKAEIETLWRELFGGPPAIDAAPEMLIAVLVHCLPHAAPYGQDGQTLPPPAPSIADPPIED